jgi:hypothetical protein
MAPLADTAALFGKIAYASSFPAGTGGTHLAKPNYAFAKRQRDLAKKQKKEAKRQRKSEANQPAPAPGAEQSPPSEKTTS